MAKTPTELAAIGVTAGIVSTDSTEVLTPEVAPAIPIEVPSAPPVAIETSPAPIDEHAGKGGSYRIDPVTRERVLVARTLRTH